MSLTRTYMRDRMPISGVSVTVKTGVSAESLVIPKGYITLARKESMPVKLATSERYDLFLQNEANGHVVRIQEKHTQRNIGVMNVRGLFTHTRVDGDVQISGLRVLALHMKKKGLSVPAASATLSQLPPYHDFQDAVGMIDDMSYRDVLDCRTSGEHTSYLGDAFKELSFFNSKVVGLLNSTFVDYNLRQSQGVCLNICAGYSMPHQPETAILANTLETVHLPAQFISTLDSASQNLKPFLTVRFLVCSDSKDISCTEIYRLPATLQSELGEHGLSLKRPLLSKVYFCWNEQKMPIIIADASPSHASPMRDGGGTEHALSGNTFASAVNRLRYIQACCDYHGIHRKHLKEITSAWALQEAANHAEHRDVIHALASIQNTSLHAHVVWLATAL